MRPLYTWTLSRTRIELGGRTAIMGILNVTPDSFSDGGKYFDRNKAIDRGKEIEQEGADLLDIGGESTRPGSRQVDEAEEVRRVVPVIEALARTIKIPISVDTYRADVARNSIDAGAQIVNDISGLRFDDAMAPLVCETKAAIVLMHSRGIRETLHEQLPVEQPLKEVLDGLTASVKSARAAGIEDTAIAIDPGIGFGKNARESREILKDLNAFSKLGHPLLVGTSRKSFLRSMTEDSSEARLWGTAATVAVAITKGAHIVRVHDVRQMRLVVDVADQLI